MTALHVHRLKKMKQCHDHISLKRQVLQQPLTTMMICCRTSLNGSMAFTPSKSILKHFMISITEVDGGGPYAPSG